MKTLIKNIKLDLALFALGFLIRLIYLNQYPIYRFDELGEDIRAYAIARLGYYPLTNNAAFIGALYNYMAALFYLLIPSVISFRLLVSILASLTIPLVYRITYSLLNDRKKALLASMALCFSPAHILVSSHVGWSASLMPFFFTLSLYMFLLAYKRRYRKYWFLTGLSIGFALQSHPSVIASYTGVIILLYWVYGREVFSIIRGNLKFIFLGFIIGYINMVIYNIIIPFGSIIYMFKARWTGLGSGITVAEYFRRVIFLVVEYISMTAASVPILSLGYLLSTRIFYVYLTISAIMILYAARKNRVVAGILLYMAITILVLAIGTKGAMTMNPAGFAWGPHYLQQMFPLQSLLFSTSIMEVYQRLRHINKLFISRYLSRIISLIVVFLVIGWPFVNLLIVYKYMAENNCLNKPYIDTVNYIKTKYGTKTPIYIEVSQKAPVLGNIYGLMVLEGFNIYPSLDQVFKQPSNPLEFLYSMRGTNTTIIYVLNPNSPFLDKLEELLEKGYIEIIEKGEIHTCYNIKACILVAIRILR